MAGHRLLVLLAGGLGALLLLLAAGLTGIADGLEAWSLDARVRLRPAPVHASPVTVVVLRGQRFDSGHRAARYALADLLETLAAQPALQRPSAVVIDLLLALEAEGPVGQETVQRIVAAEKSLGTVVQAVSFALRETEYMDAPRDLAFLTPHSLTPHSLTPQAAQTGGFRTSGAYGVRLAHPDFSAALYGGARAVGFVNILPETDGLEASLRAMPLLTRFQSPLPGAEAQIFPSLGLAGAAVVLCGAQPLRDCIHPDAGGLRLDGPFPRHIPLAEEGNLYWVNHRRRFDGGEPSRPLSPATPELLLFEGPAEGAALSDTSAELPFVRPDGGPGLSPTALAGRCLLVIDGHETRSTSGPLGERYPQALVHAQVMANVLEADYLRRPPLGWRGLLALLPLLVSLGWQVRRRTERPPGQGRGQTREEASVLGQAAGGGRSRLLHLLIHLFPVEVVVGLLWTLLAVLALVRWSVWLPLAIPGILLLGSGLGWRLALPVYLERQGQKLQTALAQRETLITVLQQQVASLDEQRLVLQESVGLQSALQQTALQQSALQEGPGLPRPSPSLLPDGELEALDRLLHESLERLGELDRARVAPAAHTSPLPASWSASSGGLVERLRQARDGVAQTLTELQRVEGRLQGLQPTGVQYQHWLQTRLQAQHTLLEHTRTAFRDLVGELVRTQVPEQLEPPLASLPTTVQQSLVAETGVVTQDPGLLRLLVEVTTRIARSDAPVLIQGETGTGKELIARAIHHHSPRQGRALVTLNCAAVAPGVLESELFGHVKGAFTGATRDHSGVFVDADGGTLFLDELGEMPLDMQARLLRALEYGEIQPVGGEHSTRRKVNVRILTATHADLAGMVARRTFREDLYFRINTLLVKLPPLRERPGDIELLTRHFLQQEGEALGRTLGLEPDALRLLILGHPWPGNVRELRTSLRRLATMASTEVIQASEVKRHLQLGQGSHAPRADGLQLDEQDRYRLTLQRQHQFSASRCEADERYGGGRQTASRHLRVWMARALWWSGWDVNRALQALAGGDEGLVSVLRPSLETFLTNLREKLAQEPLTGDGENSAFYKSLKTQYRGDQPHVWRVVLALHEGWLKG